MKTYEEQTQKKTSSSNDWIGNDVMGKKDLLVNTTIKGREKGSFHSREQKGKKKKKRMNP